MQKFNIVKSIVAGLPLINIDTDMIIPKQFLKTIKRTGLGKNLFHEMRYDLNEKEITNFVLNKPEFRDAKILVALDNFGCGSSREHAPWALIDFGIQCVIAPSFADIFYNNSFKNGLLLIKLDASTVDRLFKESEAASAYRLAIDLDQQTISTPGGEHFSFEIDAFRKHCLKNGLDEIGLTLEHAERIKIFEDARRLQRPWLFN